MKISFPSVNAALVDKAGKITASWMQFLRQLWESIIPTGGVIIWPGTASAVPQSFLLCNGAAVSRQTFAALFHVIGTTYGAGDGITTFNVPTAAQLTGLAWAGKPFIIKT